MWGPSPFEILLNIGMWVSRGVGLFLTIVGLGGLMKDRVEVSILIGPALVVAAQAMNWLLFGDSDMGHSGR